MTIAAAMLELLGHLDAKLPDLPAPRARAGRDNLPPDLVVPVTIAQRTQGVGRISYTDDRPARERLAGSLTATVTISLWSYFADDVVARGREMFVLLLRLVDEEMAHGRFVKACLESGGRVEHVLSLDVWRLDLGLKVEFEYAWEQVPGSGVISRIPVQATGELKENFTVEKD